MPSVGGENVEKHEQTQQGATGENELKKAGVNEEEIDTERADEVEGDGEDGGENEELAAAQGKIQELQQQKSELERKLMYMVAEYDTAKKRFSNI